MRTYSRQNIRQTVYAVAYAILILHTRVTKTRPPEFYVCLLILSIRNINNCRQMSVPVCNRQLAYCVRNERHVLVIRYKYNGQKHEAAVVLRFAD